MNREEYCKCDNRNKYYYRVQKLLKDWKIKNNITERCVVHHIDDEPEAVKYNEAHYELFGFEIDENGNLIFELGNYVQFMTAAEHIHHHHKGAKRSQETCEKCVKIMPILEVKTTQDLARNVLMKLNKRLV